ncbi:Transposase, partial [Ruminococcus albus]
MFMTKIMLLKKPLTAKNNASQNALLNPEKVRLYEDIHKLHDAGYSLRKIEKVLHCSRNTIQKYLHGDIISVCTPTLMSGVNKYHDHIVRELSAGKCRSVLYRELLTMGLTCKRTAAYDYFNRIIKLYNIELTPLESCTPEQKQLRKNIRKYVYISRKKIFDYLWLDSDLEIEPEHFEYLLNKYPIIISLKVCIREFREIFDKGYQALLYSFIDKYSTCAIKLIRKFSESMKNDLEAIENAVSSPLSNGFVEGTNNKVKMVKRTM